MTAATAPTDHVAAWQRITARLSRYSAPTVSLLVILIAWQLFVYFDLGQIPFPAPLDLIAALARVTTKPEFLSAAWQSATVFFVGLPPGVIVGVLMGLTIGNLERMDTAYSPYLFAFFSTPFIAIVPIFLVVFGFGFVSKAVIVFTLVWIMVVLQTIQGVRHVDRTFLEVAHAFRAPWYRRWFGVTFPAALPLIIVGVRLGIGRSLVGIIVAEFETAVTGLGGYILLHAQRMNLAEATIPAIYLALTGALLTAGLRKLELKVRRWKGDES